ncbi:uncharacterized protein LOC125212373 isoform X2 [Salvia hispanica]|uniref:uncharacterized protein LOC125212373 isoform X2 n=1 Tax=Salvia hispanica TaxID=49212 RepID=UPI002008FEA6|nr:uncharacterized protein LOC125212373 isoform X2 [Salvia hispanica]
MVVADSPEWLPPGFTVKTKYRSGKKVKYYLNVATGKKYNSKNEVIRCAKENNNILLVTPQTKNANDSGPSSVTKVDAISEKTIDSAWLPNGWTVEEKSRKRGSTAGLSYKIYSESSTGRKFYSKASVTRYLDNIAHTDIMTKQNKYYLNVATCMKYNSKNEVIHCAEENNNILLVTPQTKNADDNGTSSVTKVDATSEKTNDYAWLPSGWTVEERRRKRGSTEGLSYKIYTESSTGRKFYSRPSVTRYLDNIAHTDIMTKQKKIDKVDEPLIDTSLQISPVRNTGSISVHKRKADSLTTIDNVDENVPKQSPQIQSMTNTDTGHEDRRKGNSFVKIDNVGEPFPEMSPQVVSMTSNDGIREKKRRISSFVTVAVEWSTDKDLPDGWIKEIRTSKSGDRLRKDPFYTDPVSGYTFRSKPDALRYLETNDIRSCACKPRKRELDDIKSIENINLSSTPAKLKTQPFLGEESNGGAETSGTKVPAELDTNTLEQEQVNQENSIKSAEIGNKLEPENDVSKKDVRVMAVDAAMGSPVADPSTNQQLPESGRRIKTGSRKPKKRRESSSTPTRTSKRLAGSEPEMKINLDLNKPSLRAALRGSTAKVVDASPIAPLKASDISQSSIIEPAKEAVEQVVIGMETCQDANRPKEVEKPMPTEGSTIPAEQPGATGTAGTNPFVDGQQSQVSPLCYDFGDSWTNPLEFALKTLTGELPIEDTLTFPSCFREPFDDTFKEADVWLKQSNFDAPVNFQSEFPSHSESSKKQNAVDPSSVSFSGLGFSSCSGFNFQPSTEVGKKDSQNKFNP